MYRINPLVLFGINEHYTRNKVQYKDKSTRVIGALIGKQDGRQVIIDGNFEFVFECDKNTGEILNLDKNFIKRKMGLVKTEVVGNHFKNHEFLGWYSNTAGAKPMAQDIAIHKQLQELNDNPIYFCIDLSPEALKGKKELPATMYEYKLEKKENQTKEGFIDIGYDIDADKAETIGIESAAKSYNVAATSHFADNLNTNSNSVKRYNEKIQSIIDKLKNDKNLKNNSIMLRELNQILNQFPTQNYDELDNKLFQHYSDANIISMFSAISGTNRIINDVQSHRQGFSNKFKAEFF